MAAQGEIAILLVEDNPDDADLALRALKKVKVDNGTLPITIEHVIDGAQAVPGTIRPGIGRTALK